MPRPTSASRAGGIVLDALTRSGLPSCAKTQRHARWPFPSCAHHTLLPASWKLLWFPASHAPVIAATLQTTVRPAPLRKRTVSVRPFADHEEYAKPVSIRVGR